MREIKWIQQPKNCCGQTCLAMLAQATVEEVITLMGKRGLTRTKDLINTLKKLGFQPESPRLIRLKPGEKPPANCIVKIRFYSRYAKINQSHWILRWENIYYDPENDPFIMPYNGKFTSYLPIRNMDD